MLFVRLNRLLAAGALAATIAVPATFIASDVSFAATPSIEPASFLVAPAPATAEIDQADTDAVMVDMMVAAAEQADTQGDDTKIDAELECMAKVVVHEAGNQPREGKLAVAQLIVNRMESGRFPDTACGVVNQPRQFFQTSSYNPRRDTDTWATAVAVSREARRGATAAVVPGAMFFRAAYAAPTSFFRTRQRVASVGDHVFYR